MVLSPAAVPALLLPRAQLGVFRWQWRKLQAFLDQFAIVGTMRRFDESLLMAADMTGLPLLLYKRNKPNQKGPAACGHPGLAPCTCAPLRA